MTAVVTKRFVQRRRSGGKPRPRRGFTLLEILVTMSVITLLTALMTPAISRARVAARRVSCSTQVRSLTVGMTTYAQDFGGWLPPGPRELTLGGKWGKDPDRGSPLELFSAARIGQADMSSQNGWYGQGLLWQQRTINTGRYYYCPELENRGWGYAASWPQKMELAPDHAGEKASVTGAYVYRGGYASAKGTVDGPLNASRANGGEPILADSPLYGTMWHGKGYVVGYLGGQVEYRQFENSPVAGLVVGPLWEALGPASAENK